MGCMTTNELEWKCEEERFSARGFSKRDYTVWDDSDDGYEFTCHVDDCYLSCGTMKHCIDRAEEHDEFCRNKD